MRPEPFCHFDFRDPGGSTKAIVFADPQEVIVAHHLHEVASALEAVQDGVQTGLYAAGYVSYEAAPGFDPALSVAANSSMPLVWFGLFHSPSSLAALRAYSSTDVAPISLSWKSSVSRQHHSRSVVAVQEAIARGEVYQANYTIRLRSPFDGDDYALYRQLYAAQRPASYCAYLNLGRFRILSASPELFFQRQGDRITARPMKGTAERGRWREEDETKRTWLHISEKNRAENLMIVDLLRNDLGRIARFGSVQVPRLFEVETYATVHQMTSTVTATARPGTTLMDVFRALFPCGSVTGAPKVSAMRLLASLEDSARGVYCGSIGYVTPAGEAVFNVAIRTVVVDTQTGTAEYGVGGGITWDSTSDEEYEEILTKATVLTRVLPDFDLLETLRLEDGRFTLMERHVERLVESAQYFGIPLSRADVGRALEEHANAVPTDTYRVRMLVSGDGLIRVENEPLVPLPHFPLPVALAHECVSRSNPFLYHKTTNRGFLNRLREQGARSGANDVLLWNEQEELTEFTTGNLIVDCGGRLWTPPRECGLLAGTFRAELLDTGQIEERVLYPADLSSASQVWLVNSVRGWVPVELSGTIGCGTSTQTTPVQSFCNGTCFSGVPSRG